MGQLFTCWMCFLPPSRRCENADGNTKHSPSGLVRLVSSSHPFSMHHRSPDGRGVASLTLVSMLYSTVCRKIRRFHISNYAFENEPAFSWWRWISRLIPLGLTFSACSRRGPVRKSVTDFLLVGCPSCHPANSVKAMKGTRNQVSTVCQFVCIKILKLIRNVGDRAYAMSHAAAEACT